MTNADGVRVTGPMHDRYDEVLTPEALGLIGALHRNFDAHRRELVAKRAVRVATISAGGSFDFLPETKAIREDPSWRVAPPAPGLVDRRVEITGPTDQKMTINALNSGAKVWLADHEDANTPLWENVIQGQLNLRDSIDRTIEFTNSKASVTSFVQTRILPRSSYGRAVGIFQRSTFWSMARRPLVLSWTSRSTLHTAGGRRLRAVSAPIFTWPSSKATSRPGYGTTCSSELSPYSTFPKARSGQPS